MYNYGVAAYKKEQFGRKVGITWNESDSTVK
jgi:hypothetical protein